VKNVELDQVAELKPTFFADAMLGSIARKLRILGFDTLYIANIRDDEVLKIGRTHNRIILTCDKDLFKRILKAGLSGVLLNSNDDIDNIIHIFVKYGVMTTTDLDSANSRCAACNGVLVVKGTSEVNNESVPPKVLLYNRMFFRCVCCNKTYWEGSHFHYIRDMAKRIDTSVKERLSQC
jgi:uncharacterized protein with PIN domain